MPKFSRKPEVIPLSFVFYPQTNKDTALPVYVDGVGVGYDQKYIYRPAIYSKQILVTVSGCGTITVGGKKYSVPVGSGFYLNDNTEHTYEPDPGVEWVVDWVTFGMNSTELEKALFTSKDFLMFNFKRPAMVSEDIRKILDSVTRDSAYGGHYASAILYSTLIELNGESLKLPSKPAKYNAAISAAIEYISNHYSENITLDELCAVSGNLSEQYFCRLFKQHTGLRPVEYILRKRIAIAYGYLEKTDIPISKVAEMTGFNNTSYFYRNFKKFTGISPLTCRQNALYYKDEGESADT